MSMKPKTKVTNKDNRKITQYVSKQMSIKSTAMLRFLNHGVEYVVDLLLCLFQQGEQYEREELLRIMMGDLGWWGLIQGFH